MKKSNGAPPELTVGVDLGDRFSRLCGIDREGNIVVEVGTHSPWAVPLLESCGHEVLCANPRKLRLIYQNDRKSDRVDAEYLARVGRLDPKLLSPVRHRGARARADLAVIRSRNALVRMRTKLVNHVRGVVKSVGGRVPRCSTASFPKRAVEGIPEVLGPTLLPVLEMIRQLTHQIRCYDREIESLCEERYPETELLRAVPGVGPLVGSAHHILGPFGSDTDLRRCGLKIAERGGKNAKKRAVVAVARKLAVLLHHLWLTGEVYDPLYNAAEPETLEKNAA